MANRTGVRRFVIAFAVTAAAVAAVPPAVAKPSDPVVMEASGGTQRGSMRWYTMSTRRGDVCQIEHADGAAPRPAAVWHDGGPLAWRLPDARKPKVVLVRVVRLMVPGVPFLTQSEKVEARAFPVMSRGRVVAWEVVSGDVGYGDLDVELYVSWRGACGDDDAAHRYHVLATPAVSQ